MYSLFFSAPFITSAPIVKVTNEKVIGVPSNTLRRERQMVWLQICEVTLSLWHDDVKISEVGKVVDGGDYLSALRLMRPAQVAAQHKITQQTQLRLEAQAQIKQVAHFIDVDRSEWAPRNGQKVQYFKRAGAVSGRQPMDAVRVGEGKVWASGLDDAGNAALLEAFVESWQLPLPYLNVVMEDLVTEESEESRDVCAL